LANALGSPNVTGFVQALESSAAHPGIAAALPGATFLMGSALAGGRRQRRQTIVKFIAFSCLEGATEGLFVIAPLKSTQLRNFGKESQL
jgi:hypothetical protein